MSDAPRLPSGANRDRWDAAFAAVRRASYAGLDADALGSLAGARVADALGAAAWSFCRTDPATGLLTHALNAGIGDAMQQAYVTGFYPQVEAVRYLDMLRSREIVSSDVPPGEASEAFATVMSEQGLGDGVRVALATGSTLWGTWSLLRPAGMAPFGEAERALLARMAPHLARALRSAALTSASHQRPADIAGVGPSAHARRDARLEDRDDMPAVLTLDAGGHVVFQTENAARVLADLARVERARGVIAHGTHSGAALPSVIGGVLAQLRWRHGHAADDRRAPLAGTLQAWGASGCRYALHASLTEPDTSGRSMTVVTLSPTRAMDASSSLAARYGLSPRENAVLLRVARGESTKAIAAALELSTYTVQDHVGRACEKVGVSTRRELVAKLFLDSLG